VSEAITVNALGIWDDAQDGLNLSHGIAIYNLAGPLIASASAPSGSGSLLLEKTRWIEVPSVMLLPSISYVIMADYMCVSPENGGDRCAVFGSKVNYDPLVDQKELFGSSEGETVADGLSTIDFTVSDEGYLGPNFAYIDEFTHVPEPVTVALMGLGLAGIGYRRKQLNKA